MSRILGGCMFIALLLAAAPASAGTLVMKGGKSFTGTVEKIDGDSLQFLWDVEKDQPTKVKAGDSDYLFQAQGHAAQVRLVPMVDVESMDGIPIQAFAAVFQYNLFYRAVSGFSAGKVRATTMGDFITQVKAVTALGVVLLVLIPLVLLGISLVLPGDKVGFSGALLLSVVLSIAGLGASLASSLLVGAYPNLGTPGAQVMISIVLASLFAIATHYGSNFSFLQATAFTVAWGFLLLGAGEMAIRIVGKV